MSLVKSGTILFAASMIGNVSNYAFHFYMSRYLPVDGYGLMNTMFSILLMIGIPVSAVTLVIAKYVSEYTAVGRHENVSGIYRRALVFMALAGGAAFAVMFALNAPIAGYLRIDNTLPLQLTEVGVFLSFLVTVNLGVLQGLKSFYLLGAGILLLGLLKLLAGVALVGAGLGAIGAVSAPVAAAFLVLCITGAALFGRLMSRADQQDARTFREVLGFGAPVLVSSVVFAVLTNIDLIIVKHLFTPEKVGLYSAVSILGKTVLYLPASIVMALFPIVSEADTLNQNTFRLLSQALVYTAAMSLGAIAVFTVFPEFTIKLLFGAKFAGAGYLLKYYGLAMFFMAVVSILMSFNLARYRTGFIYTLVAACLCLVLLLNLSGSVMSVLLVMIGVGFCTAAVNLWIVYREKRVFYRELKEAA